MASAAARATSPRASREVARRSRACRRQRINPSLPPASESWTEPCCLTVGGAGHRVGLRAGGATTRFAAASRRCAAGRMRAAAYCSRNY